MDRRRFLLTSPAGALAAPLTAGAQQGGRIPHLAYLVVGPPHMRNDPGERGIRVYGEDPKLCARPPRVQRRAITHKHEAGSGSTATTDSLWGRQWNSHRRLAFGRIAHSPDVLSEHWWGRV